MKREQYFVSSVIDAIRTVTGGGIIPLHEPSFDGNEWLYLKDCLDTTFVSSIGKFVDQFEDGLTSFTGSKYAVAVVNGTSALHISLKLAGVKEGDEVLLPALTFVATANAVKYCNAAPHFVDSDELTLGVDSAKLRDYLLDKTFQRTGQCINKTTGKVIRALLPMHTFGHPVNLEGLLAISRDFNIALVEDAAESLGSYYYGKHTGTFGLFGVLSFNGNKIITTGGGGAILTDNAELARQAKHLTTTAKLPHSWQFIHDQVGYNYRMPNLNAAIGCAQLEQLQNKLVAKRKLYELYKIALSQVSDLRLVSEPPGCKSNYWLQTLLLESQNISKREDLLNEANKRGLNIRPAWNLISDLIPFQSFQSMDLIMSRSLATRIINIPSSPNLVNL